jgi:hypothetical protein
MWESEMNSLKACPLCGSTENLMVYKEWFPVKKPDGKELGVVECTTPYCLMIVRAPTIEEAIKKWNKRPIEDRLIKENEQTSSLYNAALDEIIVLKKQIMVSKDVLERISTSIVGMRDYPNNTSVINDAIKALVEIENIRKEDNEYRRKNV